MSSPVIKNGHRERVHLFAGGRRDRRVLRSRHDARQSGRRGRAGHDRLPAGRRRRRCRRHVGRGQHAAAGAVGRHASRTARLSTVVHSTDARAARGRAHDDLGRARLRRPRRHGASRPATRWLFAEGSQGFFNTYVLLANDNATPVDVTVRLPARRRRRGDASPCTVPREVAAHDRTPATSRALVNRSFGIDITSTRRSSPSARCICRARGCSRAATNRPA